MTDFFGSVRNVELSATTISLSNETEGVGGGADIRQEGEGVQKREQPERFSFVDQFPVIEGNDEPND